MCQNITYGVTAYSFSKTASFYPNAINILTDYSLKNMDYPKTRHTIVNSRRLTTYLYFLVASEDPKSIELSQR